MCELLKEMFGVGAAQQESPAGGNCACVLAWSFNGSSEMSEESKFLGVQWVLSSRGCCSLSIFSISIPTHLQLLVGVGRCPEVVLQVAQHAQDAPGCSVF